MRLAMVLAVALVVAAGCGGDDGDSAATGASTSPASVVMTSLPSTTAVATSSTVNGTTQPPTTVATTISRDSRLALEKCLGLLGQDAVGYAAAFASLGDTDDIDEIEEVCGDARDQLQADDNSLARQINSALSGALVKLDDLRFLAVGGSDLNSTTARSIKDDINSYVLQMRRLM